MPGRSSINRGMEAERLLNTYRDGARMGQPSVMYLDQAHRIITLAEKRGEDVSSQRKKYEQLQEQHITNLAKAIRF
jgi:aminoglycoside phosphotransferase